MAACDFDIARTGTLVYSAGGTSAVQASRTLVWVDRLGNETPLNLPGALLPVCQGSRPTVGRIALDIREQMNDIWVWDIARETLTPVAGPILPWTVFPLWMPGWSPAAVCVQSQWHHEHSRASG